MPDLTPIYPLVVPFLLVLFRLMGIFTFVPFFSNSSVPANVRVLLGLAITLCVWNVVPTLQKSPDQLPANLPALIIAIAGEMSIGLLIGLLIASLFAGIQLGAHMISQQMGLSMATLYDPSFEDQSTVIEQIAFWIAFVAFLSMGGHRQVINAVVYSYRTVPLGSGGLSPEVMASTLLGAMQTSFHAATRVAMPALVAFFVATLTGGLMSRSMPQLNLMSIGITLNLLVGMAMILLGLAGWALVSQESFHRMFQIIDNLFVFIVSTGR
jgi:flagellar biosynthesis protein FliR